MLDDKLKLAGKMAEEKTFNEKNKQLFSKFLPNVYSILDSKFTKGIIISTYIYVAECFFLNVVHQPSAVR